MPTKPGKMMSTPMNAQLGIPPISPEAAAQGTYVGSTYSYTPGQAAKNGRPGTSAAATVGANDVFVEGTDIYSGFGNLSPAANARLNRVMDAKYPNGWDSSYIKNVWSEGIGMSHNWTRNQGERVDPLGALERFYIAGDPTVKGSGSGGSGGGGGGGGGGYSGPVTSTMDQTSTRLTNPMTARGLIDKALTTYLGRAATPGEHNAFLQALNATEKKNPTRSRSTSTTTPQGVDNATVRSDMTTGGMDEAQFAEEWALAQEGTGEYRAATEYLDTFLNALTAEVQL